MDWTEERSALTLRSPVAGWVTPLAEVPDPIFRDRVLGDGVAIDPTEGVLRAPCDGVVAMVHRARHALTLRRADGAEILMHIGIDTVALMGAGFEARVAEGQAVRTGDPLIVFDLDHLAGGVSSLLIPVLLLKDGPFRLVPPAAGRAVAALDPLMEAVAIAAPEAGRQTGAAGAESRRHARMRDPHGLHARPAGILAERARGFDAEITLHANGRSASARSAISLMLLDIGPGDAVEIVARGREGAAAAAALAALIGAGTDDSGPETPPAAAPAAPSVPPLASGERAEFAGVQAVPGLACARAARLERPALDIAENGSGIAAETARLDAALAGIRGHLTEDAAGSSGARAGIIAAHLEFLDDPDLRATADGLIAQGKSAAFAWTAAIGQRIRALRQLGNAVLAERAADLEDIGRKVALALLGQTETPLRLSEPSILIADDVLPSHLTGLDSPHLAGLCLAGGGPTSHAAILAAAMGLPMVVAAGPDLLRIADGTPLILDADHGRLVVNPPAEEMARLAARTERRAGRARDNRAQAGRDCHTADGARIEVMANLAAPADVGPALAAGAEGCGLLRSEFLFLDRDDAPGEDEQLERYQTIADGLGGRPLTVRTLDAGGDKDLPYAGLPRDGNPALGLRGVRMSLWRPDLMRTQLRAILRIRAAGPVRILLPMVATLADLRTVRAMLDEERQALGIEGTVPLGIMIEVPSAAVMAELFAAEADFFSVGTNDLTQYTLAMDRLNPHLARQLDALHPAVLRLIASAAQGAERHGRWIGVCGGLASLPVAAPVLIGLGVTELSCTVGAVAEVKAMVRGLTLADCRSIAAEAVRQESAEAVRALLARRWPTP